MNDKYFDKSDFGSTKQYRMPEEALKGLFGYDSFRTGQRAIIENILSYRDTFAVMPTGAGKSVCYQVPAMILPGVTIVISPLISLMQDQVKTLNEAGVSAAFINSSLSEHAYIETVSKASKGSYKIIYVAPERLMTDSFISLASSVNVSMVTVDEAHCISQWGQDFRPSYMKIVEFVKRLRNRPIISAFTATATEDVRDDIVCTLGLINPFTLVTGFDRENLFFQVDKPKNKDQYVLDYVNDHKGESGIIYCATRKNVDRLYELLKKNEVSVAKYHAGMSGADRKKMQDDFVFEYTSIVVATNAFGMGIDKSNVRFVIHYNMPQSMENYYQEAGRAGRDGLDASCILLFSPQDIIINRFLLEHKEMSDVDAIDRETVIDRDNKRLQSIERYCYTTECLRNYILKYFGENPKEPCDNCGNCLRTFEMSDMTEAAKKIVNCVYESRGCYGKTIIIDTVVGAKTARLEEIGATNYKTYGVLSTSNKNLIRRLIEQLVLDGILVIGDHQVVKMGDISPLKNANTKVFINISDEDKRVEKTPKVKKTSKGIEHLNSWGFKLFDKLRDLRLEIAREEGMPPYIIFNDKTLVDMATKLPENKQEMLNVSGVGDNKYDKYGQRFLNLISECKRIYPGLLKVAVDANMEEKKSVAKKKKKGKDEFYLIREEADKFEYQEYMYISEIKDEMNRICVHANVKKLPATKLTEFLMNEEFIVETNNEGRFTKVPTAKGQECGIKIIDKVSEKGNPYTLLIYPKSVQELLILHFIREKVEETSVEEDNESVDVSYFDKARELHGSAYLSWTEEENEKLVKEFESGKFSMADLADIHGRTKGAILARLKKLNLI